MKPKFLFHGSPHKLRGEKLIPKKAEDLEKNKHNLIFGVYASSIKASAISMAIISSKGVWYAGLKTQTKNPTGIIYQGWPKQKYIYLHTLQSKNFKNSPRGLKSMGFIKTNPADQNREIKNKRLHLSNKESY